MRSCTRELEQTSNLDTETRSNRQRLCSVTYLQAALNLCLPKEFVHTQPVVFRQELLEVGRLKNIILLMLY